MNSTNTRILGNGRQATDNDRAMLLATSVSEKNRIDTVCAVNVLRHWFDNHDSKIIFQATEAGKGYWRFWNGRFWELYSEITLRSDIDWLFSLNEQVGLTDRRLIEVINTLKNKLGVPYEQFDQKPIVVLGGRVLEIRDRKIQHYEPGFQPSDYVTTGVPHKPVAMPTPIWSSMLDLVLPNQQDQMALQEMWGYAFFPALSLQTFFILHGPGGSGKDTILSVLRAMIGEERVSAVPLSKLGETHAGQGMAESVINVDMEAENMDKAGELTLKMLSGDSPIYINPKFMRPYSKQLPVKFILAANTLPHFSDKTNALWDRRVQIPFEVQIPQDSHRRTIKQLIAEVRPEFDGILYWALEGLQRVLSTGKSRAAAFTQSELAKEQIEEHKRSSNTFLLWFDECCCRDDDAKELKPDVYQHYKQWHYENGYHKPLAHHSFGRELRKLGVVVRRSHRPPDCYEGLRLLGPDSSRLRVVREPAGGTAPRNDDAEGKQGSQEAACVG